MGGIMKVLVILALLLGLINLLFLVFLNQESKVVFADSVKLFNEFEMKKEMEREYDVQLLSMNKVMDSLKGNIEMAGGLSKAPKKLIEKYRLLSQQLEEMYADAKQKINTTGWKRLNPLIFEYGDAHNYDVIVGGNGMGAVLYGKPEQDITDDLIEYVNNKYHGK